MGKNKTTAEFIEKARSIHGTKYDYSKVNYVNNSTNVCIICPEHGEFWQRPGNHIHKSHPHGCPSCSGRLQLTQDEFIKRATKLHNGKYDYSKCEYKTLKDKVCIICPEHGEFWQLASNHIHNSHPRGCPKCKGGVSLTMEEFLERSHSYHGDKYDYSKVDLKNRDSHGRVCIICPEHGEFWQSPSLHASGTRCAYCANVGKLNTEEFIKRARDVHGNRYDYSKSNYTTQANDIIITCPIHGDFVQNANAHLHGAGCPHCHMSHLEVTIQKLLDDNNINYIHIATWRNFEWLNRMSLDFYLPDFNIAIECQGKQHFQPIPYFEKGKYNHEYVKEMDAIKKQLCDEHGVQLLYYSELKIDYPYEVITDKQELLSRIVKK